MQGFKSLDPDMRDLARSMRASRWQAFYMVSLPNAMPAIFAGLKVSVTLAVVGAVVGEFVGANSGIGFVLQRSIGNFELPTMFAALVILAMIGILLFWLVDLDGAAGRALACEPAQRPGIHGLNDFRENRPTFADRERSPRRG